MSKWTVLWVALQELGAALHPVIDSGNVPDWATVLSEAVDEALPRVEERCEAPPC